MINVGGSTGGGGGDPEADLIVELSAVPSVTAAGDDVRLSALVRNIGEAASPISDVVIVVSGPDGYFAELVNQGISELPASAGELLTVDFQLDGGPGLYTVAAGVDVADTVRESNEGNNTSQVEVRALDASGLELTVTTEREAYGRQEEVAIGAQVIQGGLDDWSGELHLSVEDAAGFVVAEIGVWSLEGLSFGSNERIDTQWNTGDTFADTYRVRARLVAATGEPAPEAFAEFTVVPELELSSQVVTDQPAYTPGATARLEANLSYIAGNAYLPGSELRLSVLDGAGTEVTSWTQQAGDLLPGSDLQMVRFWPTAGAGAYTVRFALLAEGDSLTVAETGLLVTVATLRLQGSLTAASPHGGAELPVAATVQQLAGPSLGTAPMRLRLRAAESVIPAVEVLAILDLSGGSAVSQQSLATAGLEPGSYLLTLEVDIDDAGSWLLLSHQPIELLDVTAPTVSILSPAAGQIVPAGAEAELSAVDEATEIVSVEVQIDDGAWRAAPWLQGELYSRPLGELADGDHAGRARATDGAGNVGTSDEVMFTVDRTPPTISVTGVADGASYSSGVTPSVEITDAHLESTVITLDGVQFFAGVVDGEGSHRLQVDATDAAGNSAQTIVDFEITSGIAQLELAKTAELWLDADGDGEAGPADVLRYELELTNVGDGAASAIEITDQMPAHTELEAGSVVTSLGTVTSEDPLRIDVSTLAPDQMATVTFDVRIDPDLPLEVTSTFNQAQATASGLTTVLSDDPRTSTPADPTVTPIAGGSSLRCVTESFDALPSAPWQSALMGDADQGSVTAANGRLVLSGDGSELYHGDDEGHFYYRTASGDFRTEFQVADLTVDVGGQYRKVCLMARSSLDVLAQRMMACFVPHFPPDAPALQFDVRFTDGGQATELASTVQNQPLPVHLAITRRGDAFTVSYSADGTTWIEPLGGAGGTVILAAPADLLVGAMVASYDSEVEFSVEIDDFRLCHPNQAMAVEAAVPSTCDAQQTVDVVYLLDLSESMGADLADGTTSKTEAARSAIEQIHGQLGLSQASTRAALVTFAGSNDAASNLTDSWQVRAPLSADLSAVSTALANLGPGDVQPLATTPTAIGLRAVLDLMNASFDSGHQPVMVMVTDGVPNIDGAGHGPQEYPLADMQELRLTDAMGTFLSWPRVAWLGGFNGGIDTFDGEPLARSMRALERMKSGWPELLIYSLSLHGDGNELGSFSDQLAVYASHVSGGLDFVIDDADSADVAIDGLLDDLLCGAPGTGAVGGRLWNDVDGDGQQSAGEPSLPEVQVRLLSGDGELRGSAMSDGGDYLIAGVEPGDYFVEVATHSLPGGIDQPTWDADGTLTPHRSAAAVQAWQIDRDYGFGYRAAASGSPALPPSLACVRDAFDAPLAAPWQVAAVGSADSGGGLVIDGRLQVSSNGSALWNDDHMHFVHQQAASGDFRVEVDLEEIVVDPGGGRFRKTGLVVSAELDQRSPRIMVQYLPDSDDSQGPMLQFGYRLASGDGGSSLSQVAANLSLPLRLAIERRGSTYSAWYSQDGGSTWLQQTTGFAGGQIDLDLGDQPLVGMAVASYDSASLMTSAFDDFALCTPPTQPPPPPPSPETCDLQQPLDAVFLLDLSGSMTADYEGASDRLQAAQAAIGHLTTWLQGRGDDSQAALVVYRGRGSAAANVANAATVLTGLSQQVGATAAAASALHVLDLDPAASTPGVHGLHAAGELLLQAADPSHRPVIFWLVDEPPTIDARGRGPYAAELAPFDLPLTDALGDFLPWGEVAWSGPFLGPLGAFAGEPLANTMAEIEALNLVLPALEVHTLALQGDGLELPAWRQDVFDYAAWLTSASRSSADNAVDLELAVAELIDLLMCQE